jgi:hypothetical protein
MQVIRHETVGKDIEAILDRATQNFSKDDRHFRHTLEVRTPMESAEG